ncbi:MAG TPA: M48 family metallopeptidase [Nevskiaceae bacterium]|nr:M48 family metallopeptidase [Nevskiaceae bacterium]
MSIAADYYDGRSSRPQPVTLHGAGGRLFLTTADGSERACDGFEITERLGTTPRRLNFADGSFCEAAHGEPLQQLLRELGRGAPAIEHAQHSWRVALLAVVATVMIGVAAYLYGLPAAADVISAHLPADVVDALSEQTLEVLREPELSVPSKLPVQRQRALRAGFDALKTPDGQPQVAHEFLFRSSPLIGANAMALPDGHILLLDELVQLADNDPQIYAVLAHELGHVAHRHSLRLLVQGSAVGALSAWWFGDASSLLIAGPTVLLQTRYSRAFESEADAYAAAMMRANGLSPMLLAQMLEKLVRSHHAESAHDGWLDYVSSHPAAAERIRLLGGTPPAEAAP